MNLKVEELDHWPDAKSEFAPLAEQVTKAEKGIGIPYSPELGEGIEQIAAKIRIGLRYHGRFEVMVKDGKIFARVSTRLPIKRAKKATSPDAIKSPRRKSGGV